MQLKIRNRIIDTPINIILETLKKELHNGKLHDICQERNDNIAVTCPIHKNGMENHPSCNIFCNEHDSEIEYGKAHCFTCGYTATLPQFIAACLDESEQTGEEWLLERFGNTFLQRVEYLPEINLDKPRTNNYLDESILDKYNFKHPYIYQRKLTDEVIEKYKVGYDHSDDSIVFPVWDKKGNLVFITKRAIKTKRFYIPQNVDKPVYLLNFMQSSIAYFCESQINTLVARSYGLPAYGLFGTGSKYQYDIIKKSGIRTAILLFDGDDAGRKGAERFKRNMKKDMLITDVILPDGKDVADLSKQEFFELLKKYNIRII